MTVLTRRRFLFGAAVLTFAPFAPWTSQVVSADETDASIQAFDALLSRYLVPGDDGIVRVRYAAWTRSGADRKALDAFLAAQAELSPSGMAAPAAFVFWANLYNALTLKVVLDAYPVGSIKDIRSTGTGLDLKAFSGPWRTKLVTIEERPCPSTTSSTGRCGRPSAIRASTTRSTAPPSDVQTSSAERGGPPPSRATSMPRPPPMSIIRAAHGSARTVR